MAIVFIPVINKISLTQHSTN